MSSKDIESISMTVLGVVVAAAVSYAVVAVRLGEGFAIPVGIIAAMACAVVLRGPVGQALARRLSGDTSASSDEVLQNLDDLRGRLSELEERLDFTERVLARTQESAKLAQPGDTV
jgi:predicted HAD superfamily phosphohydrolase